MGLRRDRVAQRFEEPLKKASPSLQGTTASLARKGNFAAAASGRSRLFPESADPKTLEMATLRKDKAA